MEREDERKNQIKKLSLKEGYGRNEYTLLCSKLLTNPLLEICN